MIKKFGKNKRSIGEEIMFFLGGSKSTAFDWQIDDVNTVNRDDIHSLSEAVLSRRDNTCRLVTSTSRCSLVFCSSILFALFFLIRKALSEIELNRIYKNIDSAKHQTQLAEVYNFVWTLADWRVNFNSGVAGSKLFKCWLAEVFVKSFVGGLCLRSDLNNFFWSLLQYMKNKNVSAIFCFEKLFLRASFERPIDFF